MSAKCQTTLRPLSPAIYPLCSTTERASHSTQIEWGRYSGRVVFFWFIQIQTWHQLKSMSAQRSATIHLRPLDFCSGVESQRLANIFLQVRENKIWQCRGRAQNWNVVTHQEYEKIVLTLKPHNSVSPCVSLEHPELVHYSLRVFYKRMQWGLRLVSTSRAHRLLQAG